MAHFRLVHIEEKGQVTMRSSFERGSGSEKATLPTLFDEQQRKGLVKDIAST